MEKMRLRLTNLNMVVVVAIVFIVLNLSTVVVDAQDCTYSITSTLNVCVKGGNVVIRGEGNFCRMNAGYSSGWQVTYSHQSDSGSLGCHDPTTDDNVYTLTCYIRPHTSLSAQSSMTMTVLGHFPESPGMTLTERTNLGTLSTIAPSISGVTPSTTISAAGGPVTVAGSYFSPVGTSSCSMYEYISPEGSNAGTLTSCPPTSMTGTLPGSGPGYRIIKLGWPNSQYIAQSEPGILYVVPRITSVTTTGLTQASGGTLTASGNDFGNCVGYSVYLDTIALTVNYCYITTAVFTLPSGQSCTDCPFVMKWHGGLNYVSSPKPWFSITPSLITSSNHSITTNVATVTTSHKHLVEKWSPDAAEAAAETIITTSMSETAHSVVDPVMDPILSRVTAERRLFRSQVRERERKVQEAIYARDLLHTQHILKQIKNRKDQYYARLNDSSMSTNKDSPSSRQTNHSQPLPNPSNTCEYDFNGGFSGDSWLGGGIEAMIDITETVVVTENGEPEQSNGICCDGGFAASQYVLASTYTVSGTCYSITGTLTKTRYNPVTNGPETTLYCTVHCRLPPSSDEVSRSGVSITVSAPWQDGGSSGARSFGSYNFKQPEITSVTPATLSAAGGTISVNGNWFTAPTGTPDCTLFNYGSSEPYKTHTFTSCSEHQILFSTHASSEGVRSVVVAWGDWGQSTQCSNSLEYLAPSIDSIGAPRSGSSSSGLTLTIYGRNLGFSCSKWTSGGSSLYLDISYPLTPTTCSGTSMVVPTGTGYTLSNAKMNFVFASCKVQSPYDYAITLT